MNLKLKKILKEIAVFGVIFFIASNVMSYLRAPKLESDGFLRIEAVLVDGNEFKSEKVAGSPFVVHFWGTWCPVCRSEISNIQSVSQKYEVLTVAVNSGSDEELRKFMKEKGFDFRVVNDAEGAWAKKYKIGVFPTTFICDKEGKVKFTETGYTTTAGLLARLALLK